MKLKLNDYEKRHNAHVVKLISEQRPMSYDECVAQAKKLAAFSKRERPPKSAK